MKIILRVFLVAVAFALGFAYGMTVEDLRAQRATTLATDLRTLATTFAAEMLPPVDPFIEFAKEAAALQREHDADLAERMGASNVARAIREGR